MMKVAITTQGDKITDAIDLRFGRAKYVAIVDTEVCDFSVHDNAVNLNAAQGAGIQTACHIAELGAEAVITGHVGPNAFKTLAAAGIKVYQTGPQPVQEAVELFKKGQLQEFSSATVEGHWV